MVVPEIITFAKKQEPYKMKGAVAEIEKAVAAYMAEKIPAVPGEKILVGLSGGADSVALTVILHNLGYAVYAANCNFSLRGVEADRDSEFARHTAEKLGVPFISVKFDTQEYAEQNKVSIEMACRELRYDWFEKKRTENGCKHIAVAHHRDDSVETMMINLIRGTGIAGLTGISPVNGHIIRPLLCISRSDILKYLSAAGYDYVTDSTNAETIYVRNKIRNKILPLMQEINPSVSEAVERTAENLRETESLYKHAVKKAIAEIVHEDTANVYISLDALKKWPAEKTLLYEILKPYGFVPSRIDDIRSGIEGESGLKYYSPTHRLVRDRKYFIISPLPAEDMQETDRETAVSLSETLDIEYFDDMTRFEIPKTRSAACFDADLLPEPLTLRHWRKGDKFVPFGMKGRQKLSDYFNNRKFSILQKESALLLTAGEEIIWIIGERQSDKYKITDATRRAVKFSIITEIGK